MEIPVAFDDSMLIDYEKRRSPSFFFIRIVIDGRDYPNSNWMDFGGVILGWWLRDVAKLMEGENEIELTFMDGPYRLRCVRNSSDNGLACYSHSGELVGSTSVSQLSEALCVAARQVVERLSAVGVDSANVRGLKAQIAQLDALRRR